MRDRIEKLTLSNYGLTQGFCVNPDSCGNSEHYEQYIRFSAIGDQKRRVGTTRLFIRNDGNADKLLGYITLRANAFVERLDGELHGYPALEVCELAVAKDSERQHIGTVLMKYAMAIADMLNDEFMGVQYIVLCADEQAVPFYQSLHFERVDTQGEVPRENWNINCVPMFLKLPEIQ